MEEKVHWLWQNRAYVTHHRLGGPLTGLFKRRIGKFRVLYTFERGPDEMVVRKVGMRDDVYKSQP